MENKFEEQVKTKSDQQLKELLVNNHKFQEELVVAVRKELQTRGVELNGEEKERMEANMNLALKREAEEEGDWSIMNPKFEKNIVEDPEAPELFSRRAIFGFTVFCSVLFGGVLFCINLNRLNKNQHIPLVLIFSIVTTALIWMIPGGVQTKGTFVTGINALMSIVLYNYFWGKYIGKDLQYRTKSIIIPLVIGIVLALLALGSILAKA